MNNKTQQTTNSVVDATPSVPKTPIRFMLHASKPHAWWAIGAITAVTLGQICMSLNPFVLKNIVDGMTSSLSFDAQVDLLIFWAAVYISLQLGAFISWRTSGFIGMEWLSRMNATAYNTLYAYISRHSHGFFLNRFAGALSNNISNASDGGERLLDRSLWGWYPEIISFSVGMILFVSVDPVIAVGFFVVFAFTFVANIFIVQRIRPHVVAYANASSRLRGDGVDYLTNVAAARQYARHTFEIDRIKKSTANRRRKDIRQWRMSEWAIVFNNAIAFLLIISVLLYVISIFQSGAASAGDVVLILTVLGRMIMIIVFLGNSMNGFVRIYGEIEEGLSAVLLPYNVLDKPNAPALHVTDGTIRWKEVDFQFKGNRVFQKFDLMIKPGERVGLVGPSGAGKTTFVSLLLRQYDLDGGVIEIDGQDIASVTQDSLREHIAVVPQEPFLFHRTIRENIAYGKPTATENEIMAVARKAQAHDFIRTLPEGYDTLVGERGVKLSGGQKQRIAIARAMLKNAPILVLDEATSALDSESEVAIQKALHKLMAGKTVVAIAHRLSTLREMDRIIILENGKVVEDGSHEALVGYGGVYARLWEHQAGGFLQE
ncbi:MAG: ABC transporter ATP-binding protein [Candidatus Paceibacterota bacterium]